MYNNVYIASQKIIDTGTGSLNCYASGSCGLFISINSDISCTDYGSSTDFSSDEQSNIRILIIGGTYTVEFAGSAWGQMSDADSTNALRCRCSTNNVGENLNINGYNECGSICATNLPTGFILVVSLTSTIY
ncbi:unnamed protein product [Rotaria sp. Silwood1]|nr:unnamed protein product [Rotaria sp. Silwood1]